MNFSGTWRDYQARVLEEMGDHLGDGRLHIVAAPGAGKTILGLEALRRLGRPTLVLAPTRTIRDQWQERLVPLFLPSLADWKDHLSYSLEAPATLTIATYQALHAVYRDVDSADGRFEALVANLTKIGPITVIVDECHHLRREWWNALFALRDRLTDVQIVSLTATPPYDAPYAEWARYQQLCGPIDLEITVPELVRNGDLCAHQDFVMLSEPCDDEVALLNRRRDGIAQIVSELVHDSTFTAWLLDHPWAAKPYMFQEEILSEPEFLSSILIFLNAAQLPPPQLALTMLNASVANIPKLSPKWLEVLLTGLLYGHKDVHILDAGFAKDLKAKLHSFGLIENGVVKLGESQAIFKTMAGSLAKLDSIARICKAEAQALGDRLRLVILSDHVRAGELPKVPGLPFVPAKLGVVPIFETLRRAGLDDQSIGVLTGTLVIVPRSALDVLRQMAPDIGVDLDRLSLITLPACPRHVEMRGQGDDGAKMVTLMTRLFEQGAITILVGTQALLGEGWDAPSINALVLASNVGSFMLSNQMRGRAIRINPRVRDKVANIWHLATIEPQPTSEVGGVRAISQDIADFFDWGEEQSFVVGQDIALLMRRFEMFEGVANDDSRVIESGLPRLCLNDELSVEGNNQFMLMRAADRRETQARWDTSLGDSKSRSHVRKVAQPNYAPSLLTGKDTTQNLALAGMSSSLFSASVLALSVPGLTTASLLTMAVTGVAFVVSVPKLLQSGYRLARYGNLQGRLLPVSQVILQGLSEAGLLSKPLRTYEVSIKKGLEGRFAVGLLNAPRHDERIFLDSLAELLGPITNPRYLLVRKSWLGKIARADYHAVPSLLSTKKDIAERFLAIWKRKIGSANLVFTRTPDGRAALLAARSNAFSTGVERQVEQKSMWM